MLLVFKKKIKNRQVIPVPTQQLRDLSGINKFDTSAFILSSVECLIQNIETFLQSLSVLT